MAVGDSTLAEISVNCAGDTTSGSVAITAQGANTKIVSVEVKKKPPEVDILGITLSNTANTAGSLKYTCRGKDSVNYAVTLTLGVIATA